MRIFIDITQLLRVPYVTGIQRVVREVLLRFLERESEKIVLLNYNKSYRMYELVDSIKFEEYFRQGVGNKSELTTGKIVELDELHSGDAFFDIDGVWNLPLRRSSILPLLKRNGVKLVVYVYDIIPITHPQFFFDETLNNFMNYIGSYLQYADLIIASAQSTLDAIDELLNQLNLPAIPSAVSWLGSDFKIQDSVEEEVAEEARYAVESGQYVLMIGTIEPRKNHALVLEAFDNQLFDNGMNLIFAGRIGWNMSDFKKRMDAHPKRNKQFFFLEGMNDTTIDYLYKHAYCVAFPTFNEGFGLPIIEAFQRGVPVLASDIPILREVGAEYCDYFDPYSWESFAKALMKWINEPDEYVAKKEKINSYLPVTWDTVADNIWQALMTVKDAFPYEVPSTVKQIVYLSARENDLMNSLPFVEAFMPFIQEIVICCPDSMANSVKEHYNGRLKLKCITDSRLLDGAEVPKDPAVRNFFLRCRAVKQREINDVFIMADDDYRPLKPLEEVVFMKDGKYRAYYCYHLQDWKGEQSCPTSFDYSMYRTRDFLEEHHYSTLMYDSHMPQIIDKRVFMEMLDMYPGIEEQGLSDWSMYFNYLNTKYSCQISNLPYVTLAWPGKTTSWDVEIQPKDYLFENYYEELYEEGNLLEGYSSQYYKGIECENMSKALRFANAIAEHNQARVMFQAYCANYEWHLHQYPYFALEVKADGCHIILPEYVAISEKSFTRIPFAIEYPATDVKLQIKYQILDVQGNKMVDGISMNVGTNDHWVEVAVKGVDCGMKAVLEIETTVNGIVNVAQTKLCIMRKGI